MLVVADQPPLGVRGERGLPRPREAEEERGISPVADVAGAVHGEHVPAGKQVVEHGEDGLLDLAGVAGPPDQHDLPLERDQDEGLAVGAVHLGDGVEARDGDHREVGNVLQPLAGIVDLPEQVAREERLPGVLGDHAERELVARLRSCVAILDEDVLVLEIGREPPVEEVELLRIEGPVLRSPPDPIGARGILDDEPVLRAPPGVRSGPDDDRPQVRDPPLAALDDLLVEVRGGRVPVDPGDVVETDLIQAVARLAGDGHRDPPFQGGASSGSASPLGMNPTPVASPLDRLTRLRKVATPGAEARASGASLGIEAPACLGRDAPGLRGAASLPAASGSDGACPRSGSRLDRSATGGRVRRARRRTGSPRRWRRHPPAPSPR